MRVREEIEAEEAAAAALRATAEGGHKRVSFTYARGRSSRRHAHAVMSTLFAAHSRTGPRTRSPKCAHASMHDAH